MELRSRTSVELDDLRGKVSELSLAAERREVELRELKAEKEVREENLKSRTREVREKMTALEAAERQVLELREEGMGLIEILDLIAISGFSWFQEKWPFTAHRAVVRSVSSYQ